MRREDLFAAFEGLADTLIPWICERTGLPRRVVELVLLAQAHYWMEHSQQLGWALGEDKDD